MNLEVKWYKPLKLKDGAKEGLIYTIDNLEDWFGTSGVYMFCRKYSKCLAPLYIGKAEDLGSRVKQHLNSVKLMKSIQGAQAGEKVVVFGEYLAKSGQDKKKTIAIIEKSLIEHALSEGYQLLNVQGTKTPTHKISFNGCQLAKNVTGKEMYVKAK